MKYGNVAPEDYVVAWDWVCPRCQRIYDRRDLPNKCECGKRPPKGAALPR